MIRMGTLSFVLACALSLLPAVNVGGVGATTPAHEPLMSIVDNSAQDTTFDQEAALAKLRKSIEGKEDALSSEVFPDIRVLNDVPAGRLLKIMEFGFSRSLGVNCVHCHEPGKWAKEAKPTMAVARAMWKMSRAINDEYIKKIPEIQADNPSVNCMTCHRGEAKPGRNRLSGASGR